MKKTLLHTQFSCGFLILCLLGGCNQKSSNELLNQNSSNNSSSITNTQSSSSKFSDISGKWIWQTSINNENPEASSIKGVFFFKQDENGIISGDTSTVLPVQQKKKDGSEPKYFVDLKLLNGKFTDKNQFAFEVHGEDGAITRSEGKLNDNGSVINGKSTVILKPSEKYVDQTKVVNLTYEWTAKKS